MSEASGPALRVVSGSPTPEELAVLTAVVAAVAAAGDEPERASTARRGGWNDPAMLQRRTHRPGPNAWRAAAW